MLVVAELARPGVVDVGKFCVDERPGDPMLPARAGGKLMLCGVPSCLQEPVGVAACKGMKKLRFHRGEGTEETVRGECPLFAGQCMIPGDARGRRGGNEAWGSNLVLGRK